MADEILSQAEIEALLGGGGGDTAAAPAADAAAETAEAAAAPAAEASAQVEETVEAPAPAPAVAAAPAAAAAAPKSAPSPGNVRAPELGVLHGQSAESRNGVELIMDVQLPVAVELGRATMKVKEVLALGPGAVVELDKHAGEPVEVVVNNKVVARGEVVVIDENFGVRITEIVGTNEREGRAKAA